MDYDDWLKSTRASFEDYCRYICVEEVGLEDGSDEMWDWIQTNMNYLQSEYQKAV